MHELHRQTIEKLKEHLEADPRFLALIVVGSVARDEARADSDLDFVLVATDDEYASRQASRNLFYTADELTDHTAHQAGGYIIDLPYLMDAAERGDERTRFQFVQANIVFSHIPGLEQTVADIAAYPEHERFER